MYLTLIYSFHNQIPCEWKTWIANCTNNYKKSINYLHNEVYHNKGYKGDEAAPRHEYIIHGAEYHGVDDKSVAVHQVEFGVQEKLVKLLLGEERRAIL